MQKVAANINSRMNKTCTKSTYISCTAARWLCGDRSHNTGSSLSPCNAHSDHAIF